MEFCILWPSPQCPCPQSLVAICDDSSWLSTLLGWESRSKAYLGVCLWGCFQRWWGHEGSDLMNGLIHWWIENLSRQLGDSRPMSSEAWLEEVGHWCALEGYSLSWPLPATAPLCFLSPMMWVALVPCLAGMMLCLTMGPENNRAGRDITSSPFKSLMSIFCHNHEMSD
jgi:hypothetical protein